MQQKALMGDQWISVVIGLLKGVAFVYDILSFVPAYFIDNPRRKIQQSNRIKVSTYACFQVDLMWDQSPSMTDMTQVRVLGQIVPPALKTPVDQ